ncbi:MAG: glycosyltransferase [FCB group bacterium]|jgi:spore maturation protein CgeB|nr:glycosyltransferase [FCB group bacterium]
MKPAREWLAELREVPVPPGLEVVEGRGGDPTLKVGSVLLHSRYRPREEATRLIESAGIDPSRPVLVLGTGLGYPVLALAELGVAVMAVEPDPAVARLAVEGPLGNSNVLLGVGDAEAVAADPAFAEFAGRLPQVLVHPPTASLHPQWTERMRALLASASLKRQRLSVAVVGPMYGGSLPIASYLERAFKRLGHRTLLVDNSQAWELYDVATRTVKTKQSAAELSAMLVNFLGEWSYARVAEFAPDICIVMAQAPVQKTFPGRLAKAGIATAFWYVENWRHLPYWKEIAPYYDCFFHIQPGEFEEKLTAIGCASHAVVNTGCDPEIHKPVDLTPEEWGEFGCDISFAGAGYYNRKQVFAGLTDYNFKLWGVEWDARDLYALVQNPEKRFTPEQFAKIVAATKVNLNLHSSATHQGVDPECDAINPRVFEVAACGGFQVCDPCKGLDAFFDFETEVPVYRDLVELRGLIDRFLAHEDERKQYAARARERALRDHTYDRRAQQMLDILLERCGNRILRKGITVQRSVGEVVERVGRDTDLGRYLASLPAEAPFALEAIMERLTPDPLKRSHPEGVFAYMDEVRKMAEALFAAADAS